MKFVKKKYYCFQQQAEPKPIKSCKWRQHREGVRRLFQ